MSDSKLFEMIQENDFGVGIAKCKTCGCQFDFDIHSKANTEFIASLLAIVLVCPACDVKEYPEHECIDDGGMFFGHCKICRRQLD